MRTSKKILLRVLKILFFSIGGMVAVLFILPFLIPDTVSQKIKDLANSSIDGEINFSHARLSFFNHFPSLTLSLYDFSLKGSAPFKQDTLISANELAWGIDLAALIGSKIRINRFFITNGKIRILVNEKGEANYNVYKSTSSSASKSADSAGASLKIEKIIISKSEITYDDASIPMLIHARGLDYTGKGDLSKAIFDLDSRVDISSLDLSYDKVSYIVSRPVNAELLTSINTNSLAFKFERNYLRLHNLPIQFKGLFEFLSNGYKMDFKIKTQDATLPELLSVLPPEYDHWLANINSKGMVNLAVSLAGNYISSKNQMPDLDIDFKVKGGYLSHAKAPKPIENLQLDLHSSIASFNPDSLLLNVDSINFKLGKNYFSGRLKVKGVSQPYVNADLRSELDLEELDRALGLQAHDFKGNCRLDLKADGQYTTGQDPGKLRKSIIIRTIPNYNLQATLRNGYFKMARLPEAINDISFDLHSNCVDQDPDHINFLLSDLNAKVSGNFIKGYCKLSSKDKNPIEAHLETILHLAELKKFYPLDRLEVKGDLSIQLDTKGRYDPGKKQFPVTEGRIDLHNGSIQTKYYPHPIEKVELVAKAQDQVGTLADLNFLIESIRFQFEGQPFYIKADLQNFDNLKYVVASEGRIDVGKVYKVFSRQEYDVKGYIETDFSLKGTQSDAVAARYDRLFNSGTLRFRDIVFSADFFPLPFYVDEGDFRFNQDKIWFDKFIARYGQSKFRLDGALSNVINYSLKQNEPLVGKFNLSSKHLYADEFAAFAGGFAEDATPTETKTGEDGVVLVPRNLTIQFNAEIDTTDFHGLKISTFKGQVQIDSGKIKLSETGFNIIDAPVRMEASYTDLSPLKAEFDFHIQADSFDVHKAYNEVQLFRELAPSAKSVYGVIGLDYSLGGKLDGSMYPILPSLKGGGVLQVSKVKLKGFKLMNAVSKSTNKEEMTDPDLSKIKIKSNIKNNIMTIERTKMKIAGFRPRFEGQCSLDGNLNLKGRIGLPPFGIIGIPFTVKGTQDNPIVKLKRDKDGKPLEEKSESEEEVEQ